MHGNMKKHFSIKLLMNLILDAPYNLPDLEWMRECRNSLECIKADWGPEIAGSRVVTHKW